MEKKEDRAIEIYRLYQTGMRKSEISRQFNLSSTRITAQIIFGKKLIEKENSWHAGLDQRVTNILVKAGFDSRESVIHAIKNGEFYVKEWNGVSRASVQKLGPAGLKLLFDWAGLEVKREILPSEKSRHIGSTYTVLGISKLIEFKE